MSRGLVGRLVGAVVLLAGVAEGGPARAAGALEAAGPSVPTAGVGAERDRYLLTLGEHFYAGGEYYRAVGVFEELALFTGDPALGRRARLRTALALHHGLQLDRAVAAYDRLLTDPGLGPELAYLVRLQRVLVRAEASWRGLAPVPLGDLAAELEPLAADVGAPHRTVALFQLARLRLAGGDAAGAAEAAAAGRAACRRQPGAPACADLVRLPLGWRAPPLRSPAVGLALSAAVPGLGAFYAGRPVDGFTYMGLTFGSALLAWDVHEPGRGLGEQKASFYVLGTLAVTFYASSLVQGWVATGRWNEVRAHEHRRRVLEATEMPLPLDEALAAPAPALKPVSAPASAP